ncbi:flagellar cap protein FliD N-terminal domain-containing protein [Jutongia sp.]
MAIRMTGLTSGLDTESIVAALMEAQKSKKTKVENKKTKLEWTQTIWSGLNKKLYSFYTDYAGKMRFQSSYLTKKAASSDSSVLTATAKSSAANGSYSVKVSQLAAAQYVTSAKLGTYKTTDENGKQIDTAVTSTTKFADLGFDTSGSSAIEITSGDTKVNLYVDQDTTIGDFVQKLKDAGLNASFDEKQSRFFISAKNSGADSKFTITNTALSTDQTAAKDALLQAMDYSSLSSSDQSTVKQVLSDLQNSQSADTKTAAYKSLQDIADTAARTKVTDYYSEQLKDKYTSQYITTETTTDADGHQVTVEKLTDAGRQALKDANLDNDTYTDTDRLSVVKDKLISQKVSEEITADDYKQKIESAVENGSADAGVDSKATRDSDIIVAVDN